jgi:hypothetical protein
MKILNIFLSLIFVNSIVYAQPHINITFENRQISGNTWTFDLVAQILPTYVSAESNWSTMDIRTNISNVPPGGVTIASVSGTPLNPSVLSATGQTGFAGGGVANTVKYAVALERNVANPDFTPGTTVTLASMSVTFSAPLPSDNLVTPRPFGGSAQSFWTTIIDPNPRPFGLPSAFPLPIKLRSFSAVKDGERATRLDWVSSSELNSDYFGIERSQDGINWENIGQVQAAGNSNADIDYQYVDRKLPNFRSGNNIFYYRLRMTDLDGKFQYSDVRGVNFGKATESFLTIYPNPTTEIINIDLSGINMEDGEVMLSVYDANGRNMINKNVIGNGIELIEMNQYPAGTYNVVVIQGDNIQQKKIIKID